MSKADIFEKAIREFGIEAALEYFNVPEHGKDFFRKELSHSIDVGRDGGKDWEICALLSSGGDIIKGENIVYMPPYSTIYSVLRKSDGVTFSVGAKDIDGDTIESFEILGGSMRVNFNGKKSLWIEQVKLTPERTSEKPPIGIMPMSIWKTTRLNELEDAIVRYVNARKIIPPEWITERDTYISELQEPR